MQYYITVAPSGNAERPELIELHMLVNNQNFPTNQRSLKKSFKQEYHCNGHDEVLDHFSAMISTF